MLKCFTVQDDGEIQPIQVNNYEDLADDQVYLLIDHDKKHIFIWKGRSAPVRRKFISARAAQSMRNELGLTYKVISVEQGNETKAFGTLMKTLGSSSSTGQVGSSGSAALTSKSESTSTATPSSGPQLVPKVIPDSARTTSISEGVGLASVDESSAVVPATSRAATSRGTAPKVAPVATPRTAPQVSVTPRSQSPPSASASPSSIQVALSSEPSNVMRGGSMNVPSTSESVSPSTSTVVDSRPAVIQHHPPSSQLRTEVKVQPTSGVNAELVEKVTKLLEKMEKVPGMVREIVIIGDTIFSVLTEHLKLFNKEIVKLEPMEGLPDGLFPAPEYYTRLYMENGRVLFIELFKEQPADERSEFIDEMKRSLRDLTKLGL